MLASISRFITQHLKLQVNWSKSRVDRPWKRSFLGCSFTGGEAPHTTPNRSQSAGPLQSTGESPNAMKPRPQPQARHHDPLRLPARVDWLLCVLPNPRGVAGLGQLDASSSPVPPMETLEGVPPPPGRADPARGSPEVGTHHSLECQRAVADQSYSGRTHGAQQSLLCQMGLTRLSTHHNRSPHRTALVRTRMPGGVGGGSCEAFPYPDWNVVYQRFTDWAERGIWYAMLYYFAQDPAMQAIMIDSTFLRAYACAAGALKKVWRSKCASLRPIPRGIFHEDPWPLRRLGQAAGFPVECRARGRLYLPGLSASGMCLHDVLIRESIRIGSKPE